MATVYLIHFTNGKVGRCQHYVGYCASETLEQRMQRHKTSNGARLLAECNKRGIEYEVVQTWEYDNWKAARSKEVAIKRQGHHKKFCPICSHSNDILIKCNQK